jgi:hypothetical protein
MKVGAEDESTHPKEMNEMLLKDKVAVITGGAGFNGPGSATARLMTARGVRVAFVDRPRLSSSIWRRFPLNFYVR